MTSFLDPLIAFVSAHAWLAYLTLFLAALLEAVPVVGSVIPGSTIILALSALVPGGELKLNGCWRRRSPAPCSATARRSGSAIARQREILGAWPLSNYPRVVAQSEAFFHRWGALAVFFARFVPPIRAFVPITAGALGMPPSRFYAVNIPAILLWAPAHVLPGVLAVSALHQYAGLPHHQRHRQASLDAGRVVGALILALAVWAMRRRHGNGAIERGQAVEVRPLRRATAAPGRRTDIARAGPDQPAVLQLLAGMRDPSDGARHRKQHQFIAGRQPQRMHQHRERIIDIDEFAGRFRDPFGNLVGEFARRRPSAPTPPATPARGDRRACRRRGQSPQSARRARRARGSRGATSPSASVFTSCAASTPAPPCFGPFSATRPAMIAS